VFDFLRDREMWAKFRCDKAYRPLLDMLLKEYSEVCADAEIPQLPFSLWYSAVTKGERQEYDYLYIKRRRQMSVYTLLSMLYPEKNEYIEKLQDVINVICEEYSWCLPVHLSPEHLNKRETIDLFAAETGLYFAEIKYILHDSLAPLIRERMTREIKWRITDSMKDNVFGFEKVRNNWAAVCGASVGITLLYEDRDAFKVLRPRIEETMKNYLAGIEDDGSVSEGAVYWEYGFGFYLIYCDMISRLTGDRRSFTEDDKLRRIAGFYSSICMSNGCKYSFGDSSANIRFNIGNFYYINNCFDVSVPPLKYGGLSCNKFSWAIRSFLYYNPDVVGKSADNGVSYYEKMQCCVVRKDRYAFAIKGGNNDEGGTHNHNDIGSFVLTANDKQLLCDLGAPLYSLQSLAIDSYKSVLERSSEGHNVPIINSCAQGHGKEYYGKLSVRDNIITVDMKNAYPVKINSLLRKVELLEDKVILTDEYDNNINLKERFITEIKPEILNGKIIIEGLTISCGEHMKVNVEETNTLGHGGEKRTVFLIDISTNGKRGAMKFEFLIDQSITRNDSL